MKTKKLIKNLTVLFATLVVIFLIIIFASGKKERNFKTEFFTADTSQITSFVLYPEVNGHKEVRIFKDGKTWKVQISPKKSVTVPSDKIKSLKRKLTEMKVDRLVSKSPKQWNKFKVDSTGTRVKIYSGKNLLADIILGKFESEGRRSFVTYLRNANEDETYVVSGFVSPTFNRKADSFRNSYVLKGNKNDWQKLEFTYNDSSFVIEKDSTSNWYSGGTKLDSTTTWRYLSSLAHLYSSNFIDEFPKDFPKTPAMTLKIIGKNKTEEIKCYVNGEKSIIESSYNNESYFDGKRGKLKDKIFKHINYFLKKKSNKKHKSKKAK